MINRNVEEISQVLTYPRRLLDLGSERGRLVWSRAGPDDSRVEGSMRWMERPEAESSLDMVQPIPCAVIVDSEGRLCVFERPVQARRVGRLSLIVGGHVEAEDARDTLQATLSACLDRELAEEIDIPAEPSPRLLGVAFDRRSIADSRHVGYIYVKEADRVTVKPTREFDLGPNALTGRFAVQGWLEKNARHFDAWSYIIIRLREQILGT